jgi:hypothetical protein
LPTFRLCNLGLQLLTSASFLSPLRSGYDFLIFPVRLWEPIFEMNWLRVFRSAEASRMGEGERQQGHTKAVQSEKCLAVRCRIWGRECT